MDSILMDVIIIALIVIFALWGLWKGFGRTFIKLLVFAVSIVATVFIANTVFDWLMTSNDFIRNLLSGDVSLYSFYYKALPESLKAYDGTGEIGGILGAFLAPALAKAGDISALGLTYQQFFAVVFSFNTFMLIVAFVVYLVVRLVAMILSVILKKIFIRDSKPKALSRLFGFLFGGIKGVANVMVLLVIVSAILPLEFMNTPRKYFDNSTIGNFAAGYAYEGSDYLFNGAGEESIDDMLSHYPNINSPENNDDESGENNNEKPEEGGEEVTE